MVATDTTETLGGTEPVLGEATTASPAIADRYRQASVCPVAAGVVGARIRSRGLIRLGRSWWPYRGHEVTLPAHGYFREMRIAGGLRVVDSWVAGRARRSTTLLRRCLHPALVGPDLARADIAHAALSAMWVPPVLLPSDTVRWTAEGRDTASVSFAVSDAPVSLRLSLHRGGLPRRVSTVRWGDPEGTGFFREVPFAAENPRAPHLRRPHRPQHRGARLVSRRPRAFPGRPALPAHGPRARVRGLAPTAGALRPAGLPRGRRGGVSPSTAGMSMRDGASVVGTVDA